MRIRIDVIVLKDDGSHHTEALMIDDQTPDGDTADVAGEEVRDMVMNLMSHQPHGVEAHVGWQRPDRDHLN